MAGVPVRGSSRMGTSIAELIADRIDAMPAGERRAAQTLVANYPLIGLKTVADFSHRRASVRRPSCASSRGSASRTIRNSSPRCRTNSRRNCSRRSPGRPISSARSPRHLAGARGDARKHPRNVPACLGQAARRHRRAAFQPAREDLSDRRALHRSDRPLHGGASDHHPAQRVSSHRAGEQLARPADRHGQARRAA